MNAKGDITVKSDAVRQVLEYAKRLAAFCPPDAVAWDDSSNNKWLISGKGALIFNPPSAWAVAKRDAPKVAELCWTHGFPKGRRRGSTRSCRVSTARGSSPRTRRRPGACCSTSRRARPRSGWWRRGRVTTFPPYLKFNNFKTWEDEGPPKGTLYHYPNKGDQVIGVVCSPAPPLIAAQIWNQAIQPKMIVRHFQGEPMEKTLDWAESELEGFRRT